MIVYSIRKEKYANNLNASGRANRWSREDEYVAYTGGSVALSALELVTHRSSIGIQSNYKLMFIDLKIEDSDIFEVQSEHLLKNWKTIESYPVLQALGSAWYRSLETLVLKVPSALVHREYNYIINTKHPDFSKKVSIASIENFTWDLRLL